MNIPLYVGGAALLALVVGVALKGLRPKYDYTKETCPAKGELPVDAYVWSDDLYRYNPGETPSTFCRGCGFVGMQSMVREGQDVGWMRHP